jgi:hypothetical protein
VVVELELALHPIGSAVLAGMLAWPVERTAEVAGAYAALMAGAPDRLGGALALTDAPPSPFVPEALHGAPLVAVVVLWLGEGGDGERAIAPLRALRPALDAVRPMPYAALQGLFESEERFTARIHGEGGFLTGLTDDVVAVLASQQARKPAPLGSLLIQPLGGAFARVPDGASPLGRRDAPWAWQAGAAWFDPGGDDAVADWAAGLGPALAPWSRGEPYPNFMPGPDPARLRASYGPAVWDRLRAIRAAWDPDDVLSGGHAIPLGTQDEGRRAVASRATPGISRPSGPA